MASDVTIEFASKEAAEHFVGWLCESGEQAYWDYMEYREQEEDGDITAVVFDYHSGGGTQIRTTLGRLDADE